jgi:hypothetical protein
VGLESGALWQFGRRLASKLQTVRTPSWKQRRPFRQRPGQMQSEREALEKWSNLLIDFRLAVDRHKKSASKLHPRKKRPGAGDLGHEAAACLVETEKS